MGSAQGRTLLAGLVVAVSGGLLVLVGGPLGITDVRPVLLVAAAGLLVGVPRLRHAVALAAGIAGGSVTVWVTWAVLPQVPLGRALAVVLGILLLTVVSLATGGRIRLSVQLVGWVAAAMSVTTDAGPSLSGATLLAAIASDAAALLVAAGVGLLIAQVTQLVALGRLRPGRGPAALLAVVAVGVGIAVPTAARADDVGRSGLVEHRQTIVRTATADGTLTEGTVVTRLGASGTGDVTVVLRDQAVRGLRSLSGFAGPGPLRERAAPEVVGRDVTHRLGDGDTVRTVAALDRDLPVTLDVSVTLDDRPITPAELRGRSGRLTVTVTVVNTTAELRALDHLDGAGRARTVLRDIAVPLIGELTVTLDHRFRAVRSADATVTDGTVHAELVLAGPVGAPVRTVTWSADVEDAALPPMLLRVTPVELRTDARGGVDLDLVRRSTAVLQESAEAVTVARDRTSSLGVLSGARGAAGAPGDADLARGTVEGLEALLTQLVTSGAELDELRALVEAQDDRLVEGDGLVHGLLTRSGVRPVDIAPGQGVPAVRRAQVDATVVYVIDVAGQADGVRGTVVRLLLSVVLLLAVGLLGRAIGRLVPSASA